MLAVHNIKAAPVQLPSNLIENHLMDMRSRPYQFPLGFLIPFADGWFNLIGNPKGIIQLSEQVKWQVFFAASSYMNGYGIPNTGNFSVDHLEIPDLVILYRILLSFENQCKEPALQALLKITEKKFTSISLETPEKHPELLQALQEQNDPSLQSIIQKMSSVGLTLLEEPIFNPAKEWEIIQKWGLNPLLANSPGLVTFLYKSENLRHMSTFYGQPNLNHLIAFDMWGNPLLKVEGVYVTWNQFKELFRFNPYSLCPISRTTFKEYNFMHSTQGFVEFSWLADNKVRTIHTVNECERQSLLTHARKFYGPETPERNPWELKNCVFQLITVAEEPKRNDPNERMTLQLKPPHISLAIVDEQGKVYSWGLRVDLDYISPLRRTLATAETKNMSPDIEVFKTGANRVRRVTSVPVTSATAQQILNEVERLNIAGIRHESIKQNCGDTGLYFLKMAGYEVDCTMTVGEYVWNFLPSLESLPIFGHGLSKIYNFVKAVFGAMSSYTPYPIKFVFHVVTYIPSKVATVFQNLLILILGGWIKETPLRDGVIDEPISNEIRIRNFSSLIRSPLDLFNDDIPVIHHSAPIVAWQKAQGSTAEYRYKGTQLCILPPPVTV